MRRNPLTDLPPDFAISERVRLWAVQHGYGQLEAHLDYFKLVCEAKGYQYASWDAAFMRAIRDDYAKLNSSQPAAPKVCARCSAPLTSGFVKRSNGPVCLACENAPQRQESRHES
jgi:hypothetical protein